jgi:hypothetical protein
MICLKIILIRKKNDYTTFNFKTTFYFLNFIIITITIITIIKIAPINSYLFNPNIKFISSLVDFSFVELILAGLPDIRLLVVVLPVVVLPVVVLPVVVLFVVGVPVVVLPVVVLFVVGVLVVVLPDVVLPVVGVPVVELLDVLLLLEILQVVLTAPANSDVNSP